MSKDVDFKKPAKVVFKGIEAEYIDENGFPKFMPGQVYDAYFLEYWEGIRDGLHVMTNNGIIEDFIPLKDFDIVSDEDNVLNLYEATVRCITNNHSDLKYGKTYLAIGRDKNGMYLVLDETACCYFYNELDFEIIEDVHGILQERSLYYSFC